MLIRNFNPEKYYTIASKEKTNGETVELVSKLRFDADEMAEAGRKCAEYNAAGAYVVDVKRKKDRLNPGKLWSLNEAPELSRKEVQDAYAAQSRVFCRGCPRRAM